MDEHTDAAAAGADYEFYAAAPEDVHTGYLTGPGVYRLPVQYEVVDGIALYGGCIDLGTVEEAEAEAAQVRAEDLAGHDSSIGGDDDEESALHGVGLPSTSDLLWPQGRVPYTVSADLPNPQRVADAVAHIEARTPMRFVRRTAANASQFPNWVEVVPHASVNSSPVGMRGGRQLLRLTGGASMGVVVHEFLHAFGELHEHQRSDRDDFVEIRWQHIQQDKLHNFQIVPGMVDYDEYDYGSIMHYPGWAFRIGTEDTILPRRPGVTIGQRNGLSFGDRLSIAAMYSRFFARGYTGVWRAQRGGYGLWANATWDSFRAKWQEWSAGSLRLVDIHTRLVGGQTRFSGVFLPGSGGYGLWANTSWDSFRAKWQEWGAQGLRLVGLHIHRVGGENRFSGVWLPGSGGYALWVNASWDSFRAKWQEWGAQGLRLVDVHVHKVAGQNRYSGVWLAGSDRYGLWANTSWDSFRAKWQEWGAQGLRLVDVNVHQDNGRNRYTGVWRAGTGGYALWANTTWESFRAKWEQLAQQGYRLVDFEFPSPEVGAFGDADLAAAAAADGEVALDSILSEDGIGGLFGIEQPEPVETAASADDPMDLGGLVAAAERDAPASGDGEGGLVPDTAAEALAAIDSAGEDSAGGLGGLGGVVGLARDGESDEPEDAGGLVGTS